jgi:hypothetical protein
LLNLFISGKVLLTPAPSIDNALFYKLDPKFLHIHDLSRAATKSGIIILFVKKKTNF